MLEGFSLRFPETSQKSTTVKSQHQFIVGGADIYAYLGKIVTARACTTVSMESGVLVGR